MRRAPSTFAPSTVARELDRLGPAAGVRGNWRRSRFEADLTIGGEGYIVARDRTCKRGELLIDGERLYSAAWL